MSPLAGKKVKPSSNGAVCDHLLHCNFLTHFDNFSILAHENKKYLLEIKESLLITQPAQNVLRTSPNDPILVKTF